MSREKFEDSSISRYEYILDEFVNLAINRFTWKNLPLGLTSEQIELMLINHGELMGFKDKNYGTLILPCFALSDINVYGLPTEYQIIGENGKYNKNMNVDEGVLLKNNPLGTSDMPTLRIYAKRIDDLEMTQDVNLFQQSMPKLILADEDSKLTAKNIIDKIREFKFVIFGKKSLINNISSSNVLDTSSPYVIDKLQQQKNELKNEALTYLSINNNNIIKKERTLVDEVNANNEYISINLDLRYELRKNFCEQMNKKYGEKMEVEKREVKEDEKNDKDTRGVN